jgi:hypothetical protein
MNWEYGFCVGFIAAVILHLYASYMYKKILVSKANAPKHGMSNIEFILGKPYVIMPEEDYLKNCKLWYE